MTQIDVDFEDPYQDDEGYQQEEPQNGGEPVSEFGNEGGNEPEPGNGVSPEGNQPNGEKTSEDVMRDFLKFNGISDPNSIKFEDEDGIIKERAWDDLSYEEKMSILTTSQQQPERDLDDEEIKLLNDMRSKNLTPKQYIETIRQQAAQDYEDSLNANPTYQVDNLTDDEVFILDLQDKIEDITDEEIAQALDKAKENESLFKKQVAGIRNVLKAQEEQYNTQREAEYKQQLEEQFNQFKDSVVQSIQKFNKVGDLDINLEREDMEDIAAFILDRDETGMSYMGKALNNPQTLVEMAWWALKGRDALNSVSEYFANEIKTIRLQSYQKGLEDGRKGTSKVIHRPVGQPAGRATTIDDIWG